MYVRYVREGIRVVIELKRDAIPAVVQNNLFKKTSLQVPHRTICMYVSVYVCVNVMVLLDHFLGQHVGFDGERHAAQENLAARIARHFHNVQVN